uniref:Tox-ART-HYD1 domain-containing protein n=1 Tax=Globodera pallida TaxID=36090 RepID=A0A183CN28_GLOPA
MIIGNSLSSLLRVVSVSGATPGEYNEKIYDSPIFARVLPREIGEIEIELRTMDNGVGDIFRGVWRFFLPILKRVGTTVGAEALSTGQRVLERVGNEGIPLKEAVVSEGKRGLDTVLEKGGLPKQFGTGKNYPNKKYVRPFNDMNEAVGFTNTLESNGITFDQYGKTHCMYVFNLTSSGDDQVKDFHCSFKDYHYSSDQYCSF